MKSANGQAAGKTKWRGSIPRHNPIPTKKMSTTNSTPSIIGKRGIAANMMFNFKVTAINGDLATVTDDDGDAHTIPAADAVEGIARRDEQLATAENKAADRRAKYEADQAAYETRKREITEAVMAAIATGDARAHDTGTDAVSETTIYGKGFEVIAVLPHYNARLGSLGRLKIDSPQVAQEFINSAAANSYGIK